ncbi:MAG: hypothetical protein ACOCRN_01535 [Spirochaetia bacterium]
MIRSSCPAGGVFRVRRSAAIILLSIVFLAAESALFADGKAVEQDHELERESQRRDSPEEPLNIAAVQFEIDEDLVADQAAFVEAVHASVGEAAAEGADLVVFPEYVNVFPVFANYEDFLTAFESVSISRRELEYAASGRGGWKTDPILRFMGMFRLHTGYDSLGKLFLEEAEDTSRFIDRVYGTVAEEHDVYVVAGSFFSAERAESSENTTSRRGELATEASDRISVECYDEPCLTNQVVVYGPEGERVYEQDKVFLTEFEQEIVGLDAGDPRDAEGIDINGWSVGITICRDTYFDEWNEVHADRDVWIDLRGEGTEYNESVRSRLEGAVPERLADTGVPYGLTLFLTGEFYGLFWEGRSNVLDYTGEDTEYLERADTDEGYDIVTTELRPWE